MGPPERVPLTPQNKENNQTQQEQHDAVADMQTKYNELKEELRSTAEMYNNTIESLRKQLQAKSKNCNDLKVMVHTSITNVKQDLERKTSVIQNLTDKLKKRDEKINELLNRPFEDPIKK